MAILVSGGAGYIGSHTCIELLNAGYDIVVADNYYNASPVVLDRVKQITGKDFRFYKADMTRREDVEKIFSECPDITAVIQFAAYKAVGESVSKPIEYYYNNLNCSQTYTNCNCCRGRKITICVAITNWRIFAIRKQIALKQTVLLMECAIGIEKPSDLWIIIATTKIIELCICIVIVAPVAIRVLLPHCAG